ncbi:MAG TPA: ABC transporter substrate-binding protein [Candidatus Lustribacter sp.]|jgi:NitT/TauT family transport system substrate-binding protein|nr:ABC transporter substrate-binding protein [Candidatus Lustribacter sp.]
MNRAQALSLGFAAPAGLALRPAAAAPVAVRMIFDETFYTHLPLLHAFDMGFFKDEGIDLQITPFSGSSTLFLPMLARGEYDLGTVNPSPAFFNQFSGGFDVVLLATQTGSKPGWHDPSWLIVRQDLWDAKTIVQPADLKGKVVDGANNGSPIDFLLKETIRVGGLTTADVRISERFRTVDSWLEALRNKAVDVIGAPEPQASQLETSGVGHRWVSFAGIAPWYQLEYVGASAKFAKEHPELIARFLRAYVRGNDDVLRSNGKWTPALLAEAAKWSTLAPDLLRSFQGPAYPSLHGEINFDSLARIQQFWVNEKLVTAPVDVSSVVWTNRRR